MPPAQGTKTVKYLWLLRHAKATPHGRRGGSDYDRPLTTRGRRDATALGTRLAAGPGVFGLDGVVLPEIVLCSSAVRTSETAELVAEALGESARSTSLPIDGYRSLYQAGTDAILQYAREIDDDVTAAMVVGHNPTIYRVAWELLPDEDRSVGSSGSVVKGGPAAEGRSGAGSSVEGGKGGSAAEGREQLREHGFPTCSVAVMVLPIASWSEVAEGGASLAGVFSPPY